MTEPHIHSEVPIIPEHVLQAAREAGMRSVPTYDLFVQAVVEAAFEAAGNTVGIAPLRMNLHDDIHKTISRRLPDLDEQIAVVVSKLASKVAVNALYGSKPKNESAPEKAPSEKTEGGQSGRPVCEPPREGRDYFVEHGIRIPMQPKVRPNLVDPKQGGEPTQFRGLDKLHPALRAFLEAIYPGAPLRAVEFVHDQFLRADYGRPMKPAASIMVTVAHPGRLPMWVDDGSTTGTRGNADE